MNLDTSFPTQRLEFLPPSKADPKEIEDIEREKREDAAKYGYPSQNTSTEVPEAEKFPGQN
jgi:hypothetical protein